MVHIDGEWKLATPSTSNFVRGRPPDSRCAYPGSQLGSIPPGCGRNNGFTAVQMDRITKLEPILRRHGHLNIQVEDDRSPTVSVHLHTPPLRADMRTDLRTKGFDHFDAVGNPGRPQRFDVDCRHGFSTHSTCAIAAADQMPNIDLSSTRVHSAHQGHGQRLRGGGRRSIRFKPGHS